MRRLFLLLVLAAAPAVAQDADPSAQMREGIGACLVDMGALGPTSSFLAAAGWVANMEGEPGSFAFLPGAGEGTRFSMPATGESCQVESTALGTDAAAGVLAEVLAGMSLTVDATGTAEPSGCPTRTLSNGTVVELTSGGTDPACASDTTSGLRFVYPTGG